METVKAIEYLKQAKQAGGTSQSGIVGVRWAEVFGLAIEALEKQMPKEGIFVKKGFWSFVNEKGERDGWMSDFECPKCGSTGWGQTTSIHFCPNCGQAISWSVYDEA